jgi:hypothetical protein
MLYQTSILKREKSSFFQNPTHHKAKLTLPLTKSEDGYNPEMMVGLAMARYRTTVEMEAYKLMNKAARDIIPP